MAKPKLVRKPEDAELEESRRFAREDLARSGLTPDDIDIVYRVPDDETGGAYEIKYPFPGMYRVRFERGPVRYMGPEGKIAAWFRSMPAMLAMQTTEGDVHAAEGEKKAAALIKHAGLQNTFAFGGAQTFRRKDQRALELLPEIEIVVRAAAKRGAKVHAYFDGDIVANQQIAMGAKQFWLACAKLGAVCEIVQLPDAPDGEKVGLDDWIMASGLRGAKLRKALAELPRIDPRTLPEPRRVVVERLELDAKVVEDDAGVEHIKMKPTVENVLKLARDVRGMRLRCDEFLGELMDDVRYNDTAEGHLRRDMEQLIGAPIKRELVQVAKLMLMEEHKTNALADWLASLQWDGKPRLARLFVDVFNAKNLPEYLEDVAHAFLIGMVNRAINPGCQHDHMLLLCGPQGIGKTRVLDALAGKLGETSLLTQAEMGPTDGVLGRIMELSWIVSFDELAGHSRREDGQLKNLLTMREIVRNVKYLEVPRVSPVHCVFAGTANDLEPLRDLTGNRRFLVVHCGRIDVARVAREREQLFAEAMVKLKEGGEHWEVRHAEEEQEEARHKHSWEEIVATALENPKLPTMEHLGGIVPFVTPYYLAMQVKAHTGEVISTERAGRLLSRIAEKLGWLPVRPRPAQLSLDGCDPAVFFPALPGADGRSAVRVPDRPRVFARSAERGAARKRASRK